MVHNIQNADQNSLLNAIQQCLSEMPTHSGNGYSYSLDMETPIPLETLVITLLTIEHLVNQPITLYIGVFEDLDLIGLDSQYALDQESISYYNESDHKIIFGNVTLIFQYS